MADKNSTCQIFRQVRKEGNRNVNRDIPHYNLDMIISVSNFLYYLVKDHPFIDGNKRIAATLFIYFLNYYNDLYKDNSPIIDNNTLASITLLIAESNPNDKDLLIHLISNFLN